MNLYVRGNKFSIKVIESNYIRFENDDDPLCGIEIESSDLSTNFSFGGLGLSRNDLREIIKNIDKTLNGEFNENFHLQFADPHITGGGCYSPISFFINADNTHENDYWEFRYHSNGGYHNSGLTNYSVCFCSEDLIGLKASLQNQISSFDWEENGQIDYYEIHLQEPKYKAVYSADELHNRLSSLLSGKTLRKIYVGLDQYIESSQRKENYIDFSCVGSISFLAFDNVAVILLISGEGMFQYCVINNFNPNSCVKKRGFFPYEAYESDLYFFDIGTKLSLNYENEKVKNIEVVSTDTWPFSQEWFDKEKAASSKKLPNILKLHMSNDVRVCFAGDPIEGYNMYLEN